MPPHNAAASRPAGPPAAAGYLVWATARPALSDLPSSPGVESRRSTNFAPVQAARSLCCRHGGSGPAGGLGQAHDQPAAKRCTPGGCLGDCRHLLMASTLCAGSYQLKHQPEWFTPVAPGPNTALEQAVAVAVLLSWFGCAQREQQPCTCCWTPAQPWRAAERYGPCPAPLQSSAGMPPYSTRGRGPT